MGSRAHTSRAWEYGRNMLKKGQEYRRLGDIQIIRRGNSDVSEFLELGLGSIPRFPVVPQY